MSKEIVDTFNPGGQRSDLLWTPDKDTFVYPEAVLQVADDFNNTDFRRLAHDVGEHVMRDNATGIEYGEWREEGDSDTDVIAMFSTFATRIDSNMQLRGEFCNRVFRQAGLTDQAGKPLPLIFFGAPAGNARYPLSHEQRKIVASGDLGPAAAAQLELLKRKGYGRAALLGFSQGGSMSAAGARVAHEQDMDITAVGAASVPNVIERGAFALQLAFGAQAKNLRPDLDKGDLLPFIEVHKRDYSEAAYTRAMLSQLAINWALFKGMTHDRFGSDLKEALQQNSDAQTTISAAAGKRDGVGRANETRLTIENLRHDAQVIGAPNPHYVAIDQGHHSWGDRVTLLASFYAYALSR
jgi:hypothetical protein